jgi:hypothetical protein
VILKNECIARSFLLFLLFATKVLFSQKEEFHFITKFISEPYDTNFKISNINIFPAFIEWRFYPDWSYRQKVFKGESAKYVKRINSQDSSYVIIPSLEKFYSVKVNSKIKKAFGQINVNKNSIILAKSDSAFLSKELKRIDILFRDSLFKEYEMSDSLFYFFNKYPAGQQVLYTLLTIHEDSRTYRVRDLIGFQRMYVFDIRSRKLTYFSKEIYRTYGDEFKYWEPAPHDNTSMPFLFEDYPKPELVVKGYVKYLKKNKKYLEKQK